MIKRRDPQLVSMDNITLGWLNELARKAKIEAEIMDNISLCADGCGRPWTDDKIRHQRAILRGATPDVLVCNACFRSVKVTNEEGN